jgi:hypothetical protein
MPEIAPRRGTLCAQRHQLLQKASLLAVTHHRVVSVTHRLAGADNPELFSTLLSKARQSLSAARAAYEEYRFHIEAHGCR